MTPTTLKNLGLQSPFTAYWSGANAILADDGHAPLSITQANAYWLDNTSHEIILKRARDCREERKEPKLVFGRAVAS